MEDINTKAPEAVEDEESAADVEAAEPSLESVAKMFVTINDTLTFGRTLFSLEQTINEMIENCPPGPQYEDLRRLSPLFQTINGEMHFTWTSETIAHEAAADEEPTYYTSSKIHTHFKFSSGPAGSPQTDPLETNYARAVLSLLDAEDPAADFAQRVGSTGFPTKRGAVTIFLAEHPDMDPAGPCTLESGHFDEIREIYNQLDAFFFVLFSGTQAVESKQDQGDEADDTITKNSDFLHSQDGAYSFFLIYAVPYIKGWRPEQTDGQENSQSPQDEVLNALPKLQSLIPQNHIIPNNKLANSLIKDIIGAGMVEIDVSGKNEPELLTHCILNYEGDNIKLSSRHPFTEYDRDVADAVTTLYQCGDPSHIITAAQVYRTMVHATETETPSAQQIGAVTKSLDKMRFVRVQIDCSQEFTRRKISLNGTQVTGGRIDTYLLALEKLEVMAGGKRVAAYKIMKTPILYEYAHLVGQVLTVPSLLFDVRDKTGARIANTERRISVKSSLMRQIYRMKGDRKQSRHLLYTTIFQDIGEDEPSEKEQRAVREYSELVLNDWTRKGFIKGFSILKRGKKKVGIEIKI